MDVLSVLPPVGITFGQLGCLATHQNYQKSHETRAFLSQTVQVTIGTHSTTSFLALSRMVVELGLRSLVSFHVSCLRVGWKNTALDDIKIRWKLPHIEWSPDIHIYHPWIHRRAVYCGGRVTAMAQQRSVDYSSWVEGRTPTTNVAHL